MPYFCVELNYTPVITIKIKSQHTSLDDMYGQSAMPYFCVGLKYTPVIIIITAKTSVITIKIKSQ
jgi:hypothetical protein